MRDILMVAPISGDYIDSEGMRHEWPSRLGTASVQDEIAAEILASGHAVELARAVS